jgi:hypothetical protein
MWGGQPFLDPYLSLRRMKGDHSQGSMIGGDMEKLGECVGKPCCTSLCKEYME